MATPKKVEDFAGQRILAMDPRSEKKRRACAACGSSDAQRLGVKNELEIVSCRNCATVYTPYTPWYSSEYYYDSYYPEASLSPPAFIQTRLEEITAEFAPYRQTNRLLDIGCGAGNLLLAARKNGWNAHGLDVSMSAVQHVRSLGFEVFQGELQNAQFPAQHFDVITAAEIVEHHVADGSEKDSRLRYRSRPSGRNFSPAVLAARICRPSSSSPRLPSRFEAVRGCASTKRTPTHCESQG